MFFYAAWFGGFDDFPKNYHTRDLKVMGSNPIRSNAVAQKDRALDVFMQVRILHRTRFGWTNWLVNGSQKPVTVETITLKKMTIRKKLICLCQ